ncbi:MAG: SDR family NAD(P)-dependent oxidoreductase [Pseudomonadota bacterium]
MQTETTAPTGHERPLQGRVALITGASRGIGRAAALALAEAGAHIIMMARTVGALEEVDDEIKALGGTATIAPLDLLDATKVDAVGPSLIQRWPHLDIFIANAAMLGPLSPLGHITSQQWDAVLALNLNANWRLIRSLDPLLRASASARVVFITCAAARGDAAYWGPYAVSKAGVEALARTYAREVASTPIRVNLLDPGITRTGLRGKAYPGEDETALKTPDALAATFVEMAGAAYDAQGTLRRFDDDAGARPMI